MYHSRVMFEDNAYVERSFHTCEKDRPLTVQVPMEYTVYNQLCGNDADCMKRAALKFADVCDAIDLNLGCPQV